MKIINLVFFSFCLIVVKAQNKTEIYINKYSNIAVEEMNKYNIPASITLAQGILESGAGESRLAKNGNNHFGIKCHNNWNGPTIIEDDDKKGECFRKYNDATDSYRDHSLFLTEKGRYSFLFKYKRSEYKKWAKGLKKAGYATNPEYSKLLINIIEKNKLYRFDNKIKKAKQLYFAHTYGLPYVTGLGAYYFNIKSIYYIESNTSFVFSEANIGYNYNIYKRINIGSNSGIIYQPTVHESLVPQLSTELSYKKNTILVRVGVQFPLYEMEYMQIPYFKLTYLID